MAAFKLNSSKTLTITPVVQHCSACDDPFYQNSSPDNVLKLQKLFLDTINIDLTNSETNHHDSLTQLIFCPNCISKLNELNSLLRKLDNLKDRIQNAKDYINATVTNTSFRLKYGFENSRQPTTSKETLSSSSSSSSSNTSFISQIREKVMHNWISNGQTGNGKSSSLSNRRNGHTKSTHMLSEQSQNQEQSHDSIIPNNSSVSTLSESTTTTPTYENLDIFNTQINEQEIEEEEEEHELVVGMNSNISNLYDTKSNKGDIIPTQLLLIQDDDEEQNSNDDASRTQIKIEPGSLRSLSTSSNSNSNCNMSILERHIRSENINDTRNPHDYCPPSDEMSSIHSNQRLDVDTSENSCVEIPGQEISSTFQMFYDENTDFTSNNTNHDSYSSINGLHCGDGGIVNEVNEHNGMYGMIENVDNPNTHDDGFFSQDSQRHVPLTEGDSSLALVPSSSTQQKSYKLHATRSPKQRLNGEQKQVHVEMCPLCFKYILSGNQYSGHICEGKSTTSRYQCGYCTSAVFFSERVLIDHVSRHLETELLIPSKTIESIGESRQLPSTSSSSGSGTFVMFTCKLCKRKFSSTTGLAAHMKSSHHAFSIVRCNLCSKGFTDGTKLKLHMITVHSTTSSQQHGNTMTTNSKTVDKSGKKKIHKGSSELLRPFGCSFCEKGFRLRNDLRRHLLIHTGERPYTCMYCSKSFNRSHHLKTHIEVHRKRKEI